MSMCAWRSSRRSTARNWSTRSCFGYGTPGNDNPIAPSIKYAINPEPVYTYDPDKAKFHLKKAGLENLKIDFSASDAAFSGGVDAGLLMQEQAKAAGIDINVIREPDDSYWDNVWLKKPWCMSYWGGRPTCDWHVHSTACGRRAWNDTLWKNAALQRAAASRRVPKPTTPSVRRCMPKCSRSCMMTAA